MLARWAKHYSNPTPAERSLEPAIASMGVPYRFQHPIWALGYFPDFVLQRDKLVIEVDDDSHKRKKADDKKRTARLNKAGWKVVRCTNQEALEAPYSTVDRLMVEAGLPYRSHNAI